MTTPQRARPVLSVVIAVADGLLGLYAVGIALMAAWSAFVPLGDPEIEDPLRWTALVFLFFAMAISVVVLITVLALFQMKVSGWRRVVVMLSAPLVFVGSGLSLLLTSLPDEEVELGFDAFGLGMSGAFFAFALATFVLLRQRPVEQGGGSAKPQ